MDSVTVNAFAKINLTLDITGRRPDGYHELFTIMQSAGIYDTVILRRSDGIDVRCGDTTLLGRNNIAYKAAELFFEAAGIHGGAYIDIEKRIPKAAGLAGGSADAAAVLTGLNRMYGFLLDENRLCGIGVKAGADVPFCIEGGTLSARGIGDILSPAPALPDCFIVIAKDGEKKSTGALYAEYDKTIPDVEPDGSAMMQALKTGDLKRIGACLCNVFEKLVPQCGRLKQIMLECGAAGASMSGSGPSVFGIFECEQDARRCFEHLKDCSGGAFICRPARAGCVICG